MADPAQHKTMGKVFSAMLAHKEPGIDWLFAQLETHSFPTERVVLTENTFTDLFAGITQVTTNKSKISIVTAMRSQAAQAVPKFMQFVANLGAKPLMCKATDDETIIKFKMTKPGVNITPESRWESDDDDDRPHSDVTIGAILKKYTPSTIAPEALLGLWGRTASCEYIEEDEVSLHFEKLPIPTELFFEAREGQTVISYNAGHDNTHVGPFQSEVQYLLEDTVLTLKACGAGISSRELKVMDVNYQLYGRYLLTKYIVTPDIYYVSVLKRQ
jgi:hypothetical protein